MLVPGAAVGSAHGLVAVSSREPALLATPAAGSAHVQVAPAVSLRRWDAAVSLEGRPRLARPVLTVSTTPSAVSPQALGAYHRTAAVLVEAAPGCELDWSVLAAVGHVESGHGERAGTSLDVDGVARPAIVGPAVDAPALPDTDGGELDGRPGQDRAVGPMQLLPSVWTTAAVDGDGDGVRDPQDIDDAALAAGVLLCTAAPDLSSPAGRRQALRHYNATPGYVDLVERLAAAYALTAAAPTAVDVTEGEPLPEPASGVDEDQLVSPATVTPSEAAGAPAASPQAARPAAARTQTAAAEPTSPTPPAEPARQAAEEPTPERDPAPEPSEDPAEPTSEAPAAETPAPTPAEPPESETVTGVWSKNAEEQFLLDDTVVDIQALGDLVVTAESDLDGDGAAETVLAELDGLAGSTLEVVTTAAGPDTIVVGSLDDLRLATESP